MFTPVHSRCQTVDHPLQIPFCGGLELISGEWKSAGRYMEATEIEQELRGFLTERFLGSRRSAQ